MTDLAVHVLIALLLPALSFLVLAVVAPLRRAGRPAAWLSILCIGASLLAAGIAWIHGGSEKVVWEWLPAHNGPMAMVGIQLDADSSIMLVLVALVAFLVQLYSISYLRDEPRPSLGRYYTYQSLFAFSMMGLVLAPNLLQLFVCWELVGLCSYLLIGFWYHKPEAARAATKAFWVTKAGDVGLLIGIVLLWRDAGTFDLVQLRELAERGALPVAGLSITTFCIYLGAVGKSAQFPLHVWLPDAMEGPTPVSALIHAATMVTAGVYLLVRTEWLFALTPDVLTIVAWIGALTALLAAVLACVQDDIKRVLAYSTVSQLGYMMTAIGAGFAAAGFFHLLTHGVFKALLFLGAGAVIHAVHSNNLPDMGGLARRMPQTAIVFVVGTLSLAGIPLFGGFLSKEEILGAVWAGGMPGPFVVLMIVALLTAFYMFRVVFLAFWGTPYTVAAGAGDGADHAHDPPVAMLLPLWILTLASMAIGIYFTFSSHPAEAGLRVVEQVGAGLEIGPPPPPAWLMPAAVGVAVAGILLAWLTYQRRAIEPERLAAMFGPIRRAALARFWIDDLLEGAYRIVLLGLSRIVGWIDRYIVDGVLNVASAWTLDAGDDMRSIQTGRAQDYVYAVAFGVLALIIWSQGLGFGIWGLGF
jgi:NADH-quinone oxidoreductase subunit L